MRIGIVGTDNSHVDQIVRHLNGDGATGDARVVALSGGRGRRNVALAATGGIAEIVDEPAALIGLVDAVVVADRDGANHRQQAIPLLAAGLPVFVDKPLSRTVADARAMIDTARAHNAPLTSSSALRWIPDTEALVARSAQGGTPQLVVVSGLLLIPTVTTAGSSSTASTRWTSRSGSPRRDLRRTHRHHRHHGRRLVHRR